MRKRRPGRRGAAHRLRKWTVGLLAALLALGMAAATPAMAAPPLEGAGLGSLIHFGDAIVFELEVPWDGPEPQAVEARFGLPDGVVTKRGSADFDVAGGTLSATHRWRPRGTLVPGAQVRFQFVIETAEGERHPTRSATLTYMNPALPWTNVEEGLVEIWYHAGGRQLEADAREGVRQGLAVLSERFGITIQRPTRLVLYSDIERMRRDLGGGTSPWSAGAAISEFDVTVLHAAADPESRRDLKAVIAHELTHIALDHATENPFGQAPLWMHEGLATTVESAVLRRFPYERIMADAVAREEFVSLRGLTGSFPANSRRALQAYAQSNSLINYIIERWGTAAVKRLVEAYAQGVTDDGAATAALGFNLDELEGAWLAAVGAENPRLVGLTDAEEPGGEVLAAGLDEDGSRPAEAERVGPPLLAGLAGGVAAAALAVGIIRRLRQPASLD